METERSSFDLLEGEILTHIDVNEEANQILLTTESGRTFLIHHEQDCCESVIIEDTQGDWGKLVGKVVEQVTKEETYKGDPPPEYPDSWTRTTLKFKVNDATVICRWIGESNGYYSETVDISEILEEVNCAD